MQASTMHAGLQLPTRRTQVACRTSAASKSSFAPDARSVLPSSGRQARSSRTLTVQPVSFKFMKQLGLKKPDFLPDFGQAKRKALLDRFYTNLDAATYDELLAEDFTLRERKAGATNYSKKDWTGLVLDSVKPSIPDFNWTHATDGSKDKEGFAVVKLQATGHFTGKPFVLRSLPELQPTGKKFLLAEETQLVCVQDGKITKIEVLPVQGAGPRALYEALGGKVPAGTPSWPS